MTLPTCSAMPAHPRPTPAPPAIVAPAPPLRVAHVISGLGTGGAEMMLHKLLSAGTPGRLRSTVVSLRDGGTMGERIGALGVPVHEVGVRGTVPTPSSLLRLCRVARADAPDVVHGWMYHGNVAALVAARACRGRVRAVFSVHHSLGVLRAVGPLTRGVIQLNARLSGAADAIVYVSRASARQHEAVGFSTTRSRVIPNGFDVDRFKPCATSRRRVRAELGCPEDAVVVGLVGRYHPVKDHDTFLRAAALVVAALPDVDVRFALAGQGVDGSNAALAAAVDAAGLRARLFLLGERSDTPALTASLDIACLSSRSEAFPNVVGEAMSSGVPCVVTDVGDSAWMVGTTGAVVPPRDPAALARGLRDLIDRGTAGRRALGRAARERVQAEFSLAAVARQYEALYDELRPAHHPRPGPGTR